MCNVFSRGHSSKVHKYSCGYQEMFQSPFLFLFSVQKLFIYDELMTSGVLEITEKLLAECVNTQYISDLATNMSIEDTDDEASGKADWTKMLLIDALSCLLRLLFENVFSLNQEDEEEKERMAKLSWIVLNNIISCHNRMK